ncbi:hypothetical protein VNI00_011177 [Paramarasmius palmivorus]|uniref:Peptidase M24 domain-containing protein n=1 Tax=Paramarasmius palmivorus TaxID=297713 RepID=A0AAW0CI19_9AGAR
MTFATSICRSFYLTDKIRTRLSLPRTLVFSNRKPRLVSTSQAHSSTVYDENSDADCFGTYSVILPEEPYVFGVSHIKPREVPEWIQRPSYAMKRKTTRQGLTREAKVALGGEEEEKLRASSRLARDVRRFCRVSGQGVAGVTTNQIDAAIHEYICSHGAYPSPLLYQGFPKSCCTSVNNVIRTCRPLEDGDLVNIDITVHLNGYHGDTSQTWFVGDVDRPGQLLWEITNKALYAGIQACGPGKPFKGIGKAIHNLVKEPYKGIRLLHIPAIQWAWD